MKFGGTPEEEKKIIKQPGIEFGIRINGQNYIYIKNRRGPEYHIKYD